MIDISEYSGKRLEWSALKKLFPDSYVILDEFANDSNEVSGVLVAVTKDRDEMWSFLINFVEKNGRQLEHFYTTESMEFNLWKLQE